MRINKTNLIVAYKRRRIALEMYYVVNDLKRRSIRLDATIFDNRMMPALWFRLTFVLGWGCLASREVERIRTDEFLENARTYHIAYKLVNSSDTMRENIF